MNPPNYRPLLAGIALLAAGMASAGDNTAGDSSTNAATNPLPAWQSLEFEQKTLWVTASSTVKVDTCPYGPENWQLSATASVARNSEEFELYFAAADGRAYWRSRLGHGQKQQRYKTWAFEPAQILRKRHEPDAEPDLPPAQWPLTSSRDIAYPAGTGELTVTDAYALLVLAERFQQATAEYADVLVNTDFNFYRVRMSHIPASGDNSVIDVNYQLTGEPGKVSGKRKTRGVALTISPLDNNPDKADFNLLGLTDNISLLFDASTGLPLQLRGDAPRVGSTRINLKTVTLRPPAP